MHELSIIVPVFNEADNVADLFREIKSVCDDWGYTYEIVFVDDGSTDKTAEKIKTLSPMKYVGMRRNFGQTAALDAGIRAARYDLIVTMDGDRQNDPADIPRLIAHLVENDLDIVSGWRKNRKDGLAKRFISRGANKLRYLIIHDGIHDSGCSLKVYKKECFNQVALYGEMHRFIPAVLKIKGFKVGEIVVNHRPRTRGVTKYNWRRTLGGFIDMLSVWFWNKYAVKPLHLLGGMGLGLIVLGMLATCYSAWYYFAYGKIGNTAWPILSAFLLLSGTLLFVMGLIADMLSKTYYQTTPDKSYSVKEIVER